MRCTVKSCRRTIMVKARGLCSGHYQQWLAGKPFAELKEPVLSRDEYGNKLCSLCKNWKAERAFASSSGKADHLQAQCRKCKADQYRATADIVRDKRREFRFGITRDEFDALLASQGGVCAICGSDSPGTRFWHVDHDHACCDNKIGRSCGKCIRGVLCHLCNTGIGHLSDNPTHLRRAADYIEANARPRIS